MIQNHWNLILLFLSLNLPLITVHTSTPCNRSCGHSTANRLPFPFGFSDGCEIPLNCSEGGDILIGDFLVLNVTSDSILIYLPMRCNRSIQDLGQLFGRNYALTWHNGILLQNCSLPPSGCPIPTTGMDANYFQSQWCDPKRGNVNCFGRDDIFKGFMALDDVNKSLCKYLLSSIAIPTLDSSIKFQMAELGWWLVGQCECSRNANCTEVETPVAGQLGYRCQCNEGFEGDGFKAGIGCRARKGSTSNILLEIRIAVSISGFFIIVAVMLVLCYLRKKFSTRNLMAFWKRRTKNAQNVEAFLRNYGSIAPKRYKYSDIKKMTNSFKDKLGEGGYGGVFKGKLLDGSMVAVKVLRESKGNGEEFLNEVASITKTSHVNVVRLLGFCFDEPKRALIYEFMPNGSLEKFIYDNKPLQAHIHLGWKRLYEIAVGIAQGLEYLHLGCNTRILHFDIKPHNILLDEDFCPKISDFGLAKLCPRKESIISMAGARGTAGYIAPEVFSRNFGEVPHKSDVYSYGMMVLEMVGGRKNVDVGVDHTSEIYFPHWIYQRIELHKDLELHEVMTKGDEEIAKKMILVGLWCIQTNPSNRPSIGKVVEMLEGNLESLQIPPKPSLSSS